MICKIPAGGTEGEVQPCLTIPSEGTPSKAGLLTRWGLYAPSPALYTLRAK